MVLMCILLLSFWLGGEVGLVCYGFENWFLVVLGGEVDAGRYLLCARTNSNCDVPMTSSVAIYFGWSPIDGHTQRNSQHQHRLWCRGNISMMFRSF